MNLGLFKAQVNEIEQILKDMALLKERNKFPAYSDYGVGQFKKLTYLDLWKKCYEEKIFDFILKDDSLLQFRANKFKPSLDVSYVYYECPYKPPLTMEEFFEQEKLLRGEEIDEYELLRDYDLLKIETKECVTPLRYDYNSRIYIEGRHPASHVHFGHKNDIRVGTKKILRPISFILFIIRQCYPDEWDKLKIKTHMIRLSKNVHSELDDIDSNCFNDLDLMEMCLT